MPVMSKWYDFGLPRERKPIPDEMRVGVDEMAKIWGVSRRRVLQLCKAGKVYAAKMVDGKWSIPRNAEKPVDGRHYRSIYLAPKLQMVLQYADRAVLEAKGREYGEEDRKKAFCRFLQDSAFHMHKAKISELTYADVSEILSGKGVGGKPLRDQFAVVYHKRAIAFIIDAARRKKALSVALIEQIHSIVVSGVPTVTEHVKRLKYVRTMLDFVNGLKTHPIQRVAIFFTRFLFLYPFKKGTECTAYLVANFMLMKMGYPPAVLYRALFKWWRRYTDDNGVTGEFGKPWVQYFSETDDEDEVLFTFDEAALRDPKQWDAHINSRMDSTVFTSVFAKAVRRSCRLGFFAVIPVKTPWCKLRKLAELPQNASRRQEVEALGLWGMKS